MQSVLDRSFRHFVWHQFCQNFRIRKDISQLQPLIFYHTVSRGLSLNILWFLLYSFALKLSKFCYRVNGFCPGIHCQPSLIEPFLNADLDRCEIVNVHDFGPCVKSGKTIMQITQTQKDALKPMNTAHFLQIFGQVAVSYLHLYKYLTTLWVFLWTRLVSVSRLLPSCLAS